MNPPRLPASSRFAWRLIFSLVCCPLVALLASSQPQVLRRRTTASPTRLWYRGSTHTHTINSFDGESTPLAVAARYKELGYNFVLVTDHNKLTTTESVNAEIGVPGQFLVIRGEEVTDSAAGKPVHLAALNNSSQIAPVYGNDVFSTLQNDVDAIRQAGGLPIIAHPNFRFALSSEDLKNVTGASLFEVYNAHPVVNNWGDATHSSVEAKWDEVLSSGKILYGVASDDEHTLVNAAGALPGRAWIMVRAASLDVDSITQALAAGEFYATTGVTLQDYQVSATAVTVTLDSNSSRPATVDFIGRDGQLLQHSTSNPAVYSFTGHEQYVRAKIVDSAGQMAWTQPVFTQRLNPVDAILNGASMGNEPELVRTISPDSIAIINGIGLAVNAIQTQPESHGIFPTSVAGTTVTVNGRAAEIYYVSATQVNFHVPAETELGTADIVLTNADGIQFHSQITVADSAPGIFTANGSGSGKVVAFDLNDLLGSALVPTDSWRRFYLYTTGVRGSGDVQVWVDGQLVLVDAVRSCRGLPGLDQVTIIFPRSMVGPNPLPVVIKVDGVVSNTALLQP